MKKRIVFFHTTLNTPAPMRRAFEERFPGAELTNVVDDSIIPAVRENDNKLFPAVYRKLLEVGKNAQLDGALAVVCMCTTIADAARYADQAIDIPFLTIDGPMMEEAAEAGERIAVLITAETTKEASAKSMAYAMKKRGTEGSFDMILVEQAWNELNTQNNKARHDELIERTAREAAKDHDVIVLAQATMADVKERLCDLEIPVLTSVDSGIEQLRPLLCEGEV